MLVSHTHEFIFLKTLKTAGTSVEILLERFCDDGYQGPVHRTAERVTPAGVIGVRGPDPGDARFYNHAAAAYLRELLGETVWRRYRKIACVRNPFDKAVSAFWYANRALSPDMPDAERRARFRDYATGGHLPIDWPIYTIDDEVCVDILLRYERLAADVDAMAATLGLDIAASELGDYKRGHRPSGLRIADHYDAVSEDCVRTTYARDFARLGYPTAMPAG